MLFTIYTDTIFTIMLSLPFFWVVLLFHWAPRSTFLAVSTFLAMLSPQVHYLRHRGDVLVCSPRTKVCFFGNPMEYLEPYEPYGRYMNHNINNIILYNIYNTSQYIYICIYI